MPRVFIINEPLRAEGTRAIDVRPAALFGACEQCGGRIQATRLGCPIDTACRTEYDGHLVPAMRYCVTESVHAVLWVRAIPVVCKKQHAGRAE